MKLVPRHSGLLIEDPEVHRPGESLRADGALELAAGGGVRQRPLDLGLQDASPEAANEVLKLIDELKPRYRSAQVRRRGRTLVIITPRA